MAVGYIYVLSNPSYAEVIKVGYTCGSVDARARELSSGTAMVSDFVVEAFRLSDEVEEVEKLVHKALAKFRVRDGREFFRVPIGEAMVVIESLVREPLARFMRVVVPQTVNWNAECRRCGFKWVRTMRNPHCPKCENR